MTQNDIVYPISISESKKMCRFLLSMFWFRLKFFSQSKNGSFLLSLNDINTVVIAFVYIAI